MRREKEVQAHREKQEARDHMIGYLGSLQKRAEADYDTQIFRAQAEREAKEAKEEKEKLEKRRTMQDSIVKHRQETVKRRQAQKEIDEREEAEMRQKKAETDQLYQMYQQEKDRQRRQDAQTLSNLHVKQAVGLVLFFVSVSSIDFCSKSERIANARRRTPKSTRPCSTNT